MALSGTLNTTDYEGRYLKFTWYANQNIGANTSTISWKLEGAGEAQAGWYKAGPIRVGIAGINANSPIELIYTSNARITLYNGTVVSQGTFELQHESNGSKSFGIVINAAIYLATLNVSGSASWDLNAIPRKATILTAPDFTDEDNPTITYSNPLGTNLNSLQACISFDGSEADISYRDINKTGTLSYTFNLTNEERNILRAGITSGTNRKVRFYVRTITLDGNTDWSWVERTFSITDVEPVVKITELEDVNATTTRLTGSKYRVIPGFSHIAYAFTATPSKGATVKDIDIETTTNDGKSVYRWAISPATSGVFTPNVYNFTDNSTTLYFKASATDSRGYTASDTESLKVVKYKEPVVELYDPEGYTEIKTGEDYIRYRVFIYKAYEGWLDGTTDGSGGGIYNTVKLYHRYEQDGVDSGWIEAPEGYLEAAEYYITINNLDYTKPIAIQVKLEDKLTSSFSHEETVRLTPVFDWSAEDFKVNVPLLIDGKNGIGIYKDYPLIREDGSGKYIEIGSSKNPKNVGFYGDSIYSGEEPLYISSKYNINIDTVEDYGIINIGSQYNNGEVYIKDQPIADFVVEYGTSDIFNYRKWKSGRCECWGSKNYGNMAVSTSWGSGYESATFTQTLPSGLFVVAPDVVNIKIVRGGGGAWVLQGTGTNASATSTGNFSLYRPVSGNLSQVHLSFYCMGRWK